MVWVEPDREPNWDIAQAFRDSFPRNLKILRRDYPKPYALFGNQWQIPHWETGAPGMAVCAQAIREGRLRDVTDPFGKTIPLLSEANIPNHGVLGRQGAAGYLKRTADELARSEEHTSELQSLMRNSNAVFCLKKKKNYN